ncbi:hypothetical protein C0Q70_05725 [Pomacea canaliculata]|uniref:BEACH-type PH domain-containing protein n=1 Tax=Pomacea canaliculata TaxID=400727 RepID=A0A2T7PLZ8_POMCA|nr:hypothetical protein C0Q70_05725 [Pomacea canaliculata]
MAVIADDSGKEIKSVQDVLKTEGNDELKFGLLIGLIKVNQVSSKDVVDTVLHLLVGGEFDIENNFIIQNPKNILHMLKLLEVCPHTLQAEIWSVFTAMLKKSRRNLAACTDVGLIGLALKMLGNAEDMAADLIVEMLGILASYSITVKELRALFAFLKAKDGKWPRHSVKLISVLRQMPQRQGPDEFFSFPGKKGSHIALPPIKTWPAQNGWTFSCWLRLDPVTGASVEREKPYIYCFRTSKGIGYSAHFVGEALVITSMKVKGKGFQHCVKYEFQPRRWYMVTLVHVYNRWSRSEIRCYVDGQLVSSADMSWLVSTSDPFDKCYLGSSVDGDAENMFCGQMSTVYLFSEALLPQQIQVAYQLGPGYKSQFRFDNESTAVLGDSAARVNVNHGCFFLDWFPPQILYDGRLTSSIVFMYNPIACDSQLCLESSPKGNPSFFVHTPHAMIILFNDFFQDVKAVITHSIHSTLHSLGGVQILFPLFGQLDMPVDQGPDKQSQVDYTTCANLMDLLCDLLKSSSTIQQQFLQSKGFLVISYLLEKSSRDHITPAVLEAFLDLTQYLVKLPTGSPLLKHLFDYILFNPQLWVHTSVEVQTKLYCYLATEFINDAHIYTNIRRVSAILQTMHSLKFFYWVVSPQDRSGIIPKGLDGPRPTCDEIVRLRSFMLLYLRELIIKGQGILEDELQSMLNYLTTLHEDDNLLDVLELLVELMAQHPASMVPAFDKKNGVCTVFKLLASQREDIRLLALRLLGFFLMRSTYRRKQDAMNPYNLFSLLAERLMLHSSNISMNIYHVLFEILTERMSLEKPKDLEPESTHRIENSAILKVVATMIRQSKATAEVLEVKKKFLSDLTILCNNNKDNRRTVLQMSVWQDWLFSMAYIYPRNAEQQKITDMVMALFRMLLHHAIKYEFGGWRVWIDTLAILHSKVTYEDFTLHMSKVYHQYEQQRTDDISDPKERQQRPISTISGLSSGDTRPAPKSTVRISEVTEDEAAAIEKENGEKKEDQSEEEKEKGIKEDGDHEEQKENVEENSLKDVETRESADGASVVPNQETRKEEEEESSKEQADTEKSSEVQGTDSSSTEVSVSESTATSGSAPPELPVSESAPSARSRVKPKHSGSLDSEEQNHNQSASLHRHPSSASRTGDERQGRTIFSPGPRAPPFRIPEFRWSYLHQKLLSDLLFAVETDIQGVEKVVSSKQEDDHGGMRLFRVHSTKNVIDFVNAAENHIYVVNVTHMISQLADNLITSCGGLLPLLAAATSPNGEIEILEPNQGLSIEQAVSILQRIMAMTDILVFASSTNFAELEQEKNMPSGGILRQCLRLVCTAAVRNCLECRHRYSRPPSEPPSPGAGAGGKPVNGVNPIQSLIGGSHPSTKNIVENLAGQVAPIKDPEKLLQDMDINRLRAVVYRDVEETKQAQFLALAIVYFTSVLMVSKYPWQKLSSSAIPLLPESSSSNNGNKPATTTSKTCSTSSEEVASTKGGEMKGPAIEEPSAVPALVPTPTEADIEDGGGGDGGGGGDDGGSVLAQMASGSLELCPEATEQEASEESKDEEALKDIGSVVENKEADVAAASGDDKECKTEEPVETESKEQPREVPIESDGVKTDEKSEAEETTKELEEKIEQKPEDVVPAEAEDQSTTSAGSENETREDVKSADSENLPASKEESEILKGADREDKMGEEDKSSREDDITMVRRGEREEAEGSSNQPISSITVSHKPEEGATAATDIPKPSRLDLTHPDIPDHLHNLPVDGGSLTKRLERALGSVAPLLREIFVDFAPFLSKTLIGSHGQELLIGGLVTLKQSTSVVELVMLLCSQEWQNSLQKHAGLAFIELVNEGRLLAHATRDHIVRVANEAEFILNRMRAEDVQKHAEFESLSAQLMLERREEEKLCDHLIKSAKRRDHSLAYKLREKVVNILTNKHGAWGEGKTSDALEFWKLDVWEDDSRRRRRLVRNPLGSTHPQATLKAAIEHGPVALSTSCKLIVPGVAVNGTMSITKSELYFEMDDEDAENKKIDPQVLAYVDCLHGKWNFSEVRAIFSRRYLLQNVAIEIFMANRTAMMFALPDHNTVKKVIDLLPRVGVGIKYGLQQARRMSLASGKQLFKLSNMTQKWQRREISNFDYIMYLNTVAGRTYNDLNQYHVFPWVLVSYDSEELDLSTATTYRDLSKPIGALNETRRSYFEERYATWEHEQIPPFHYGTHYSTAAFTLNWLIRIEPFTTLFLNLQGGKFDHPNRIFSSIAQAWKNCQRDTSDVKELIPEFFFLPEMLVNSSRYELGKQEDGQVVSDVELPPWAKTQEDFIRINRQALESEFVSGQLHHWIDLIFGYKQRGPEAVRATNVFYYLTYEGNVSLEAITDPVMREAVENQIRSFGQTPSQLLTEPHPPRSSVMHLLIEKHPDRRSIINKSPMMFSQSQEDVCMIMKFLSNSPVVHVAANTHPAVPTPAITTITANHHFAINKWNNAYVPQSSGSSFSSEKQDPQNTPQLPLSMDQLLALNTGLQRRTLGDNFDERLTATHSSFVTTADNRFIFACGFWDKSFRLYFAETAKILQVVFGHYDVVTVVGRSECNVNQDCYVVTGAKDCSVMVWMFNAKSQAILGDNGSKYPTPKAVLTGHQSEVTCVAVIAELGIVVSGSKDPLFIAKNSTGFFYVFMNHMAQTLSRDGQYLILSGDGGVVEVWRSHDFTLLYTYPQCDSSIRSLALTHDHKFLIAGLATGCILVFNIDFNKWHHEYQERYT